MPQAAVAPLQAVIPVSVPGAPPLAVALLGGPRSDMQLLHIAGKLAPQIQRSATDIASRGPAKQQQQPQQQRQQQEASRVAATHHLQSVLSVLLYVEMKLAQVQSDCHVQAA